MSKGKQLATVALAIGLGMGCGRGAENSRIKGIPSWQSLDHGLAIGFEGIDEVRRAVRITMTAHFNVARTMAVGQREADVKTEVSQTFANEGANGACFGSIVGAGPNGVEPHYGGSQRIMAETDLVVVDIGARKNGYCSDLTRTFPASGQFSARHRELYELVLAAQRHAEEKVRNSEISIKGLDRLVREFFRASPLRARDRQGQLVTMDKFFIHGLGHYLGRQTHEPGDPNRPLRVGDIFTIEPGLYIASEATGIRIEDDYYISEKGLETLSAESPKDPDEIEALMAR